MATVTVDCPEPTCAGSIDVDLDTHTCGGGETGNIVVRVAPIDGRLVARIAEHVERYHLVA